MGPKQCIGAKMGTYAHVPSTYVHVFPLRMYMCSLYVCTRVPSTYVHVFPLCMYTCSLYVCTRVPSMYVHVFPLCMYTCSLYVCTRVPSMYVYLFPLCMYTCSLYVCTHAHLHLSTHRVPPTEHLPGHAAVLHCSVSMLLPTQLLPPSQTRVLVRTPPLHVWLQVVQELQLPQVAVVPDGGTRHHVKC